MKMLDETKRFKSQFEKLFTRQYGEIYWIDCVENQFSNKYSYIFYAKNKNYPLTKSTVLCELRPLDPEKQTQLLTEIRKFCKMTIHFKTNKHMTEQAAMITEDSVHGHSGQ